LFHASKNATASGICQAAPAVRAEFDLCRAQSLAKERAGINRKEADAVLREGSTDLDITSTIQELETEMLKAAEDLKFEKAALLRDQIKELKHMLDGTKSEAKPVSYRKSKRARK
jgi:excinuclease ABC subunit B